eukprot:SAG11_NODE_11840_length_735_cov_2.977987_1_plen_37_part_10
MGSDDRGVRRVLRIAISLSDASLTVICRYPLVGAIAL